MIMEIDHPKILSGVDAVIPFKVGFWTWIKMLSRIFVSHEFVLPIIEKSDKNGMSRIFLVFENVALRFFCRFPGSWRYPHLLRNSCFEMACCFAYISRIAYSTRVFVNKIAFELIRDNIFERKYAINSLGVIKNHTEIYLRIKFRENIL